MIEMLALRWHARRDVRLETVPEPDAAAGFALVQVSLCGVCGSDLHEFRSGPSMIRDAPHPLTGQAPPVTMGHELSGRIVDGGGVIADGARVTVDACWRCGACEDCLAGDYNWCRYGGSIGLHSDGGFARLVRVPTYTAPIPDAVTDEQAALTEPFAVALHALRRGGIAPAESVAIFGFGPIGAAGALLARAVGAIPIVIEKSEERLEAADQLDFAVVRASESLAKDIRRLAGAGGTHLALDSTGIPATLPAAIDCTRRGGRIIVVGLTSHDVPLDPTRLTFYERSLIGSLAYRHDLPAVLSMIAAGMFDPASIVTDVQPLSRGPQVFAELADSPGRQIKVLIDPAQ